MDAIPPRDTHTDAEQITGISCPECPGVLGVARKNDYSTFRCRIGHTFSLHDLLVSKENRLENALWAAVTAIDELAALLHDVTALREKLAAPKHTLEDRMNRAVADGKAIRLLIEQNERILFGDAAEDRG